MQDIVVMFRLFAPWLFFPFSRLMQDLFIPGGLHGSREGSEAAEIPGAAAPG